MSEIKITKEEILRLVNVEGQQCQVIYERCRRQFVGFLKEHQLDWKIGKRKKRSALLHQALCIACHDKDLGEKPMAYLQQVGRRLYTDRYPEKELDRDSLLRLPPIATDGFIMEATQLEEKMAVLDDQSRELMVAVLVAHEPVEKIAEELGQSPSVLEAKLQASLGKIAADLEWTAKDFASVKVVQVEGKNTLLSSNNRIKQSLEPINKGFLGLSSERLEEKLQRCEQIRVDQGKLTVLAGKNLIQQREIYWEFRKKMANSLVENSSCKLGAALKIAPKVWENFLNDFKEGKIKSPLDRPLESYLLEECLAVYQQGNKEELKSANIEEWDRMIAAEEGILEKVRSKDQRFLSQLVKELAPEFSSILRKIFKLYDPGLQNRPSEIYYRCFAEVVYKVEKEELTKPLTSTFRTYLIGVGSNVYRQEFYRQGEIYSDINEEITEGVAESCSIEDKFQAQENAAKVAGFLNKIGDPCRSLIEFRYLKGFSYQVISDRTGKKEGALRTQLSRCMEKIRKLI